MSYREAVGLTLDFVSTYPNFSNFQFVDTNYRSHSVVRRIFSLARKLKYKSLLIEKLKETDCPLLASENALIAQLRPDFNGCKVHRIHFFKSERNVTPNPEDYLGYLVYKEIEFANDPQLIAHVYECVIQSPRQVVENSFLHSQKSYQVISGVGRFPVRGVLYAQQDGLTHVCAHASLRTALSAVLPAGDVEYSAISQLAGIDHSTIFAKSGLDRHQIEKVLSGFGLDFNTQIHEPKQPNAIVLPIDYQRHLYGLIESGRPTLVGFEFEEKNGKTSRHMICVIGHTFNEDTWVADAQRCYFGGKLSYYPSENWLSSYVVHDDNLGPYLCSPRNFLQQDNFRILCGITPSKSKLTAVDVEAFAILDAKRIALALGRSTQYWYNRFVAFTSTGRLVLRSLLTDKLSYKRHIEDIYREAAVTSDADVISGIDKLPDNFWIVELSAPELFSCNRHKFGEIIIGPNPSTIGGGTLFAEAARLPGFQLFRQPSGAFGVVPTQLVGHTPLFSLI